MQHNESYGCNYGSMSPGWPPEAVLKHWISPSCACTGRVHIPKKSPVTLTWPREVINSGVTWGSVPLESSREPKEIPSDWTLWRSSRTHRTAVTSVTLVLFRPSWPPEAVLKHWMTYTNRVTRNLKNVTSETGSGGPREQDRTERRGGSNIDPVKPGKSARGGPGSRRTNDVQGHPSQSSPWCRHAPCRVAPHSWWRRPCAGPVGMLNGVHDPVGQPLLGQCTAPPWTAIANKELVTLPYTGGGVNVSLQGPHWAQESWPALPRWWVEAGQFDRLIDIGGCQYLRKECHIRPQYNPRTIWVPSQASLTHRKGSSPTRFTETTARRNAAFMDSHLRSAWARGSKGGRHTASNNRGKSHAGALLALGGRSLSTPLRNKDISLWDPTVTPSIWVCWLEMAATNTFRVEWERPLSKRDCKKSRMTATGQYTRSTWLSAHHWENIRHLLAYCTLVDGALALSIVLLTESLQLKRRESGPAEARPTGRSGPGRGARSDPSIVRGDPSCWEGATESCSRACAAVETKSSPARRGPPAEACGPTEGLSEVSARSGVEGERRRATPSAIRGLEHPAWEGWSPLSKRTREDNESTLRRQRGPLLPVRNDPKWRPPPRGEAATRPVGVCAGRGSLRPGSVLLVGA